MIIYPLNIDWQNATENLLTTGTIKGLSGTFTGLTPAGFVTNTAAGLLQTQTKIVLTTDVSGILPIANGGTNKNTWANTQLVYASAANVLGQSANLTFDGTDLSFLTADGKFTVNRVDMICNTNWTSDNISFVGHSTTAGWGTWLRIFSKNAFGTGNNGIQLFGYGTYNPTGNLPTNYHRIVITWDTFYYSISTGGGGTQAAGIPLRLYTNTNTTQLVLNLDGSVSIGGDLSATSFTGTVNGTIWADGAVEDGTYTVGNRITPATGDFGTITVSGGIITSIQEAT